MESITIAAERDMIALSPEGVEAPIHMSVAIPTEEPDGNWSCVTDNGIDGRVIKIYGVEAWQALEEAIRFCRRRACDREDMGWKFRWPGEDEFDTFKPRPY